MYSFSSRQYFWEYINGKKSFMYWFSIRKHFWEYISGKRNPLMYSFSIRQYFWEYTIEKIHLCILFQLGNTFGNIQLKKSTYVFVFN